MCYELASVGAKLILSARNKDRLEQVKTKCLELSGGKLNNEDVLLLSFDITDHKVHKTRVQDALKHFGKIDVLINNAGRAQFGPIADTDHEVYEEIFQVNFFGSISLTKLLLQHFQDNEKGHIVTISSIGGKCAIPGSSAYGASKFALQGYFESLRMQYYYVNIQVTLVCPGPFESSLCSQAMTSKKGEVLKVSNFCENAMPRSRCAHLALVAVANQLNEVWIGYQPSLLLAHGTQYFPDISRCILSMLYTKSTVEELYKGNRPPVLRTWKPFFS